MSLRSWLAERLAPRASASVNVPPPDWFLLHPWLKEAGVAITPDTAVQVAAVYGCCRLIVDSLAPAPVSVIEVQKDGKRERLHDDPVGWTLNYGAPIAQAPDALTSQAIEEALYWSALTNDGNGYAEIQRDRAGRFFALWPIESERVTPKRDESGFYYEIRQYQGGAARLEAQSMFHLRGPSLRGYVADSVVYRAAKAIGIAQAAQVFSAAYFANGTVISGVLKSEKTVTPEQAENAKKQWIKVFGGGPAKHHQVAVLGGGFNYEALTHNAKDAQLIEARRFQVQEIARFFGVPTTLLADNEAWTNLSELYLGFYRNALRPWAERFDAEATRKLFPQRQPWREIQHDLTHLTLGSFKDQVAALVQATGNKPIWTVNEARAVFDKNSVPDGDSLEPTKAEPKPTDPSPAEPKVLPPKPGAEPEEPEGETPAPVNTRPALTPRDAAVAMFADAFARHARRIKDDRPRSAAGLAQDCAAARALALRASDGDAGSMDLAPFAEALEQGEPPDKAAERFVSGFWRDAA